MPNCGLCYQAWADAFVCDECAFASDWVAARAFADERFSASPTFAGRRLRQRVDRAAAHEQLLQLQTITENHAQPVGPDPDEDSRSKWLIARRAASWPSLTGDEKASLRRRMPGRIGPFGEYASKRLRDAEKRAREAA